MSKWCQDHWDRLRANIDERGLSELIAPSGEIAAEQTADQLRRGLEQGEADPTTPANFDPLMAAFWAIESNVASAIGPAALYLLAPPDTPEDPVEGYGPEYDGRTWPRCPLCYLGLAHEVTCRDESCVLPKVDGYAWMLDRAADDAKAKAIELGLIDDRGEK